MKMIYGGVPVNSMKIKHYELDTNSATVQPSDLQAGVTCFAKGKKMTGTGKAFNFAIYGTTPSNNIIPVPDVINTVVLTSVEYPVQINRTLLDMGVIDFTMAQTVATVVVDGVTYPVTVQYANNILTISCDTTVNLEYFFGKDDYR